MTGDLTDLIQRLKSNLPTRWFPDETPVLDTVLSGLGTAWSLLYGLLLTVKLQSRIATVTGDLLDAASFDFFGGRLARTTNEPDSAFRGRLQNALVREHATRGAVNSALETLTGFTPAIFEPARVADTGAYNSGKFGYGVAGAWGNLDLPFQFFIKARRPSGQGIANVAGYGTGGPLTRTSLAQIAGQVKDEDITGAVISVLPTAATAWINIGN